ncbi:MAG: DUF4160 domain-containing protein [Blautia sp.]|nr:DUF4160 domain-containing protein [Blautia sp.]MCM1201350.1 DUF4160 domain-containing protein [Bacteroides fragilis]
MWSCEVCQDCILREIHPRRNERNPELTKLKLLLVELYSKPELWSEDENNPEETFEYGFDEDYRENFMLQNCFTEAWRNEGRIISFLHPAYKTNLLPFTAFTDEERYDIELDNIYSVSWWERSPEIRKWLIGDRYSVEIRGKEFEYHPPHFHVSCSGYQAVFHLDTGEFYKGNKVKMPPDFLRDIKKWYNENKAELGQAWNLLHPPVTYNMKS